jgi:hypothetical protein
MENIISRLFKDNSKIELLNLTKQYPSFFGFAKVENLSADPLSCSSDPRTQLEESIKEGYKVKIKKGVKRITLFRFLLAKTVFDVGDGVHLDEYIVMMELYYDLIENSDPTFVKKYGSWLKTIEPFIIDLSNCKNFPMRLEYATKTLELYVKFLEPHLPTQSAYYGLKGNRELRNSWTLILNSQLTPQGRFHKSVIGVGYRDKGHRKESHDGQPSWREVANHFTELFQRIASGELLEEEVPSWLLSEFTKESPD